MKLELRRTQNRSRNIYSLYIDGETDEIKYGPDGIEEGHSPWKLKKKHLEKIMQVKCSDVPDGFRLFIPAEYKLAIGRLAVLDLYRTGNKLAIEIWFGFFEKGKETEQTWCFNPFLLTDKIIELSKNTILAMDDVKPDFIDFSHVKFIYFTDLNGIIGDKFKIAHNVLSDIVSKAEEQVIAESVVYLKKKKK